MTLIDVDLNKPAQMKDSLLKISDCEDVASYNWIHDNVPTIMIPGMENLFSFRGVFRYSIKNKSNAHERKATGLEAPHVAIETSTG